MKKLSLQKETLLTLSNREAQDIAVGKFVTGGSGPLPLADTGCNCSATCAGTNCNCSATCYASCNGTCGATCNGTCATCGTTCATGNPQARCLPLP
jgi:hypothetical protein